MHGLQEKRGSLRQLGIEAPVVVAIALSRICKIRWEEGVVDMFVGNGSGLGFRVGVGGEFISLCV